MRKLTEIIPAVLAFVLMFAVGICLGSPATGSKGSAAKTSTKTTSKNSPTTSKSPAKSMAKSSAKKTSHALAAAEDLSGTITAVDPSHKEVTLVGSNGIPYDFDLTGKTRVELSGKSIGAKQLPSESHKQATVHFVPTSRGNLAKSIQISS